jgi:hypothetical protein
MGHSLCYDNKNLVPRITIFEGVDGAGKSIAAERYAKEYGAVLVHSNNQPYVKDQLARTYVEKMLPALLNYQAVVMDRCWLSEFPYCTVMRSGVDRIGPIRSRMLDRLAARHGAVVVLCDPGIDVVADNFLNRGNKQELLAKVDDIRSIHSLYKSPAYCTHLPVIPYNYTTIGSFETMARSVAQVRPLLHRQANKSAGFLRAKTLVVTAPYDKYIFNEDPLIKSPGVSFHQYSTGYRLTEIFEQIGVTERDLIWCTSDTSLNQLVFSESLLITETQAVDDLMQKNVSRNTICLETTDRRVFVDTIFKHVSNKRRGV